MSKKRNLAVLMAAATVATSVAPVFAAEKLESQNMDEATLIAEVEKLLATKYTNPEESGLSGVIADKAYQNSVYQIFKVVNGEQEADPIESVNDLKTEIENAKLSDGDLTFNVYDKGHATVDGKVVATEKSANTFYSDITTVDFTKVVALPGITVDKATDANAPVIKFVNGSELELRNGDYTLDFEKPLDKDGNALNYVQAVANADTAKKIVGFEKFEEDEITSKDIPSKLVSILEFSTTETTVDYKLADLLTKEGYTATGAEFVNTLVDANKAADKTKTIVKNGNSYAIKYMSGTNVVTDQDGYKYTVTVEVSKNGKEAKTYNLVVKGTSADQKLLSTLKSDVEGINTVKVGNLTKLSGEDRFATAVEISKDSYNTKGDSATGKKDAKAVVLVGQDAVVDGLAASPLAAQKEAPILLTQTKSVPASTISEIKRTVGKDATIYLVGGKNTISEDVEKQLISEVNAKIVRISGVDRYDTSLEIADELLGNNKAEKAFVVGGNGEADAMSIAAVASKEGDIAPIIVTPADGLTKGGKSFFKESVVLGTNEKVAVIGGANTVSIDVLEDLNDLSLANERISGADRNSTNAKVIDTYFADASVNKIYVAKDGYVGGNGQLIDALAVAPIAGLTDNSAPIVLSTNDLNDNQTKVLKAVTKNDNKKSLVQVGEGTAASVIDSLLDMLKLK